MSTDNIIIAPKKQYKVLLGFPNGGGPCMNVKTARAIYHCTKKHECGLVEANGSWCNSNRCLAIALQAAEKGEITHFALLHQDISPQEFWIDILIDEMDRLGADMVSAVVPIKDPRGVTTAGIGNRDDRWHPLKRFTMQEVYNLPETFNAEDAGFPGMALLHSEGCCVCDLRKPVFASRDDDGVIAAWDFTQRIIRNPDTGEFLVEAESEDWYWSRRLWELGAKTYVTRKVRLEHEGFFAFPNTGPWGVYDQGDEDTKTLWQPIYDQNTVAEQPATAA